MKTCVWTHIPNGLGSWNLELQHHFSTTMLNSSSNIMCVFGYKTLLCLWMGCVFCVGLVHCTGNSQVQISANFSLKLGFMVLFTHLKLIFLQCFQFSVFGNRRLQTGLTLQKVDDISKMYFVYDKINFNFSTMNH